LKQRLQQWCDGRFDVGRDCVTITIEIHATVVFEVFRVDKIAIVVFDVFGVERYLKNAAECRRKKDKILKSGF